jgi:hypothetical protein
LNKVIENVNFLTWIVQHQACEFISVFSVVSFPARPLVYQKSFFHNSPWDTILEADVETANMIIERESIQARSYFNCA